jgi:hypothetical protein
MRKNIIKISILFFLIATIANGQVYFTPSVYYTYGNYSNQNFSNSFAFYSTLGIDNTNYFTAAFEQLKINNDEWTYNQKMITAGYTKTLYPFYVKIIYSHIMGDFKFLPFPSPYKDFLNVYSASLIYNYNLFYCGASLTYQDLNGCKSIVSKQFKINIDWIASTKITISVSPLYTTVTDGRALSSVLGKLNYRPINELNLTFAGMVGKRAYYFDENLLTIFNQDETQKQFYSAKIEYSFSAQFKLPIVFQYSDFDTYNIKYFTVGLVFKL